MKLPAFYVLQQFIGRKYGKTLPASSKNEAMRGVERLASSPVYIQRERDARYSKI